MYMPTIAKQYEDEIKERIKGNSPRNVYYIELTGNIVSKFLEIDGYATKELPDGAVGKQIMERLHRVIAHQQAGGFTVC